MSRPHDDGPARPQASSHYCDFSLLAVLARNLQRRSSGSPQKSWVSGDWAMEKQAKQPLFSAVSVKQYGAAIRDMYKPLRLAARLISNDTKPIVACQFNKCK
jgi:hypothetical protein